MKHTDACIARTMARAAWELRWPLHCTKCGGIGGHSSPGCSVPYGMGNTNLPDDWDTCPDCIDVDKCPRCGAAGKFSEDDPDKLTTCSVCGWPAGEETPWAECECYDLPDNMPATDWGDVEFWQAQTVPAQPTHEGDGIRRMDDRAPLDTTELYIDAPVVPPHEE